jgi:hypothetical protein
MLCTDIMASNEDLITEKLEKLEVAEKSTLCDEDYYVHIDVLSGSSSKVGSRINTFMIKNDAYDPRRGKTFPTDLLSPGEKDTLKRRRNVLGIKGGYYEFWKVRKNFSLSQFQEMVNTLPKGVTVRIVRIMDNDHDINRFTSPENEIQQ